MSCPINTIINVFNKEILAFEIENCELKIGDSVIVKVSEDRFVKKSVLDIQLDNISYPRIKIDTQTRIAVKLEPPIKKNQEFFIKKVE